MRLIAVFCAIGSLLTHVASDPIPLHEIGASSYLVREDYYGQSSIQLTKRQVDSVLIPDRVKTAKEDVVSRARALVLAAINESKIRNKARLENPARNSYFAKTTQSTIIKRGTRHEPDGLLAGPGPNYTEPALLKPPPALLNITDEIADAAALLAELDAVVALNGTMPEPAAQRRDGVYWMEDIDRRGSVPWGDDPGYQVFRNVFDFGAYGDGIHDDTKAIRAAIHSASVSRQTALTRCGEKCNGSTTKNAIVYFPTGRYLVSSTIYALFGTQLIGNAASRPTIVASPSFVGMGVLSANEYVPDGGHGADGLAKEWYIVTANFYRQIRNFIIDIRPASQDAYICGIHYQIAQATSLQFVDLISTPSKDNPATTQQGIFSENGSGGHMSDLYFSGGNFGFYGGNQQFTAQRMKFENCRTAVQLIWDWGWVWKSIEIINADIGFRLDPNGNGGYIGSIYVMDSSFKNTGTAILTTPASREIAKGTTGLTLDNVLFDTVTNRVIDTNGKEYVENSPSSVDTWTLGPLYLDPAKRDISLGFSFDTPREDSLVVDAPGFPKKRFFERAKPQYEDVPSSDGTSDDTSGVQRAFDQGSHVFVDSGNYILTDTVTIKPGTIVVGEAWSQFVARGSKFSDSTAPRPMIKVGNKGDVGSVEIQDLIFTTKGATAGVVLVEWNLKADAPGSAGMWDAHVRIGGALGTDLTPEECPPVRNGINENCSAASLMMHITKEASAYLENVWLWVADHLIDDLYLEDDANEMPQLSVYVARGLLVESRAPTWLYGTSSEHCVFYQYNFHNADGIFAAMMQTESPYYQPTPRPPAPFENAVGKITGDPDFSKCISSSPDTAGCDQSWAIVVRDSGSLFFAGLGLYSWFSTYTQDCIDEYRCQNALALLENNKNLILHNIITIGAKNSIISDRISIPAKENQAIEGHPRWSQITVIYPVQNKEDPESCREVDSWDVPDVQGVYFKFGSPDIILPGYEYGATKFFVTMVNGMPYSMVLDGKSSYQMNEFTFETVPPGHSPQHNMWYGGGTFVDINGEAYYHIEGTDKKFQIRGTTNDKEDVVHQMRARYHLDTLSTHDVAAGSQFELKDRDGERAVNFVLTGTEEIGYWSSVNPPVGWMSELLEIIGNRTLQQITMIGSHDAGMSFKNGPGTIAPEAAILTQGVDIYGQLMAGSRWFDVRPVVGNGGNYLTGHYSGVLGANGQSLADIVENVNRFLDAHGELVILSLTHAINTDEDYRPMSDAEWENVYDIFEGISRRCEGLQGNIPSRRLNELIGNGRGCVIILSEHTPVRPEKGIYGQRNQFPSRDHWSDTSSIFDLTADQIAHVRANRNLVSSTSDRKDDFLIMQWVLTLQDIENLSGSIEKMAVRVAYDSLFWRMWSNMTPWAYPNVVLLDYVGIVNDGDRKLGEGAGEARALVMAMNLALAGRNCWLAEPAIVHAGRKEDTGKHIQDLEKLAGCLENRQFWEDSEKMWYFQRLVFMDSLQDYGHFEELYNLVYKPDTPVDLPALLREQYATESNQKELALLCEDDQSVADIRREECKYFSSLQDMGKEREAVARKLTVVAELNPTMVADRRLWHWLEKALDGDIESNDERAVPKTQHDGE